MVGTPSWLYYLFGLLMLAVAAYCFALLATSGPAHRSTGRDVEISHVAMGVAMAGMFVPAWAFGPSWLWELVFIALLAWFIVKAVQSIQQWGLHIPHTAIHALMSFAMLLMFWYPLGSTAGAMSMAMSPGSHRMDPGLAFIIAFVLFGSAIFTIASPNRGASHFGSHGRAAVITAPASGDQGAATGLVTTGADAVIAIPGLVDASHVVMCVGMGLMLIFMI